VNGTTPVHKKIMKDTPTIKKPDEPIVSTIPKDNTLQKEIYLLLIASAAADGKFLLGNLPNAQAVVKQGDHLRGVSELLTKCYEK
jgi:hypothetical protein